MNKSNRYIEINFYFYDVRQLANHISLIFQSVYFFLKKSVSF